MIKCFPAAASLLVLSAVLAIAQGAGAGTTTPTPVATPSAPPPSTGAPMPGSQANDDLREWQVARMAKILLSQAITTAETRGDEKGGRAIEADFEKADGTEPAHYAIKVIYPSGKLVEYGINADTGKIYKTENQPVERYFTFLTPASFKEANVSLKEALTIAEQKVGGGKAYEASVSKDGKAVQYAIKVATADAERTVTVGPDGKVID